MAEKSVKERIEELEKNQEIVFKALSKCHELVMDDVGEELLAPGEYPGGVKVS